MPTVTTIIVTYNSAEFIRDCLDSLLKQHNINQSIVVVDNASLDNTPEILNTYQNQITVICNSKNVGFSAANNPVITKTESDYIFSFNPDAILPDQHSLATLINVMKNNPHCGVLSSRIISQRTGRETTPSLNYPFQNQCSRDFSQLPGKWAWFVGASCLIRGNIFRQLGGFGRGYFMYGDDADLCLRMREAGFYVDICPDVTAYHIGGGCENQATEYAKQIRKQHGQYVFLTQHYPKDDVQCIVKQQLAKAKRHLLSHQLRRLMPFVPFDLLKHQRYLAHRDTLTFLLKHNMDVKGLLHLIYRSFLK